MMMMILMAMMRVERSMTLNETLHIEGSILHSDLAPCAVLSMYSAEIKHCI